MSAASSTDNAERLLSCVVKSTDSEKSQAFIMSPSASVESVKTSYAGQLGINADTFVLLQKGSILNDQARLESLTETMPGLVEIYVEEKVPVFVDLNGPGPSSRRQLMACPSQTPRELQGVVERLFEVEDQRVRLQFLVTSVHQDRPLRDSGVREGATLIAKLGEDNEIPSLDNFQMPALGNGSEASSEPALLQKVRIVILRPTVASREELTLSVANSEVTWRSLSRKLTKTRKMKLPPRSTIAFQLGRLFNDGTKTGRAIECLEAGVEKQFFRALTDGREIEPETMTHHTHLFLSLDQPVLTCPGHIPVVYVSLDTHVVNAELKEMGVPSLWDKRFLVLLTGLESRTGRNSNLFLELSNGAFCDTQCGTIFPDNESVAKEFGGRRDEWRQVIILFRDKDWLPQAKFPVDKEVNAYVRRQEEIVIADGGIWLEEGASLPHGEDWKQPCDLSPFQKQLTDEMNGNFEKGEYS